VPNHLLTPCRADDAVVTAALDVLFDGGGGVRAAHPEAPPG
jgi:hypothetical protein